MGTAWFVSVSVMFLLFSGQWHGVAGCGGTYTETSGSFTSPGYPDKYDNGITCTYTINTGSTPVSLTFKDFVTEKGFDHVKIYDANSTLRTTLAGSFKGFIVQPSSHLRVVFTTDGSGCYKGFKAAWIQSTLALSILPYSLQVKESSNLRMDCSNYTMSDQSSAATYKWTHGGSNVSTEAVLTRRNISRNQTGQYTCTASNTKGTASVTVSVDVQYRPTIARLPSIYQVKEASRLRIDCSTYTAPGNPSTTRYRWTYGGSTVSTSPIVYRSSIRRSQGGQYTCTASNTQGSASSSVAVDIQYRPTIARLPSIYQVKEASRLRIDCSTYTAPGNPSTTRYRWTYGGSTVSTRPIVYRSSIRRSQGGQYTCTASNTQGSASSSVAVDIQYIDTPRLTFEEYEVQENDTVTLSCNVSSNPIVTMAVRRSIRGTVLVDKRVNSLSHTIQRAQCLDTGTYTCSAGNTAGYNNATKKLNVLCPPRHDYRKQLDSVVISNKQRAASLVADIIANPRPSFTWHRYDGQVMSSVSGGAGAVTSTGLQSALQINITSDVDYGDYTVDVENSEGRARLTYTLSAASPPSAPSQVQVLAVGDTSVSLQWVSGYNGGANQTFTMLYKSDLHYHWAIWRDDITDPGRGTQVKEAILSLTPTLAYQFHLYGVNVYGEGEGVIINTTTLSSGKYELAVGLGTSNGAFMVITFLIIGYVVRRRTSGESTNTHADEVCGNVYTDPVAQMHCQVTELECVYEPVEAEKMQSAEAAKEEMYCNTADLKNELERVYVQFEMGRMQSAEDAEQEVYCNTAELNNESIYMNTL